MKRRKKIYDLGDTWVCECRKKHVLDDAYLAAHWDIELIHTCTCGLKHTIKSGEIQLVLGVEENTND